MIKARNLCKSFNGFQALKGIDLNVGKGEIYGFIGHNGAGKTTTMNILTGLSRPSSGECTVNGKNVLKIGHPGELNIGYLPEEPKFYPWLTAYETLDYLGNVKRHQVKPGRVFELLEWVGLKDSAKRRVGGYSRGMRQRLGIAAALVHDPELLFFDEPSSALDPEGRSDVLELIKDLKGMGKTVFFSTHILDDVERVCDRVGMLVQGRIVLEKPLEAILNENISPIYDIELMNEIADVEADIQKLAGISAITKENEHLSVTVNNSSAASTALMEYFSVKGIPVRSLSLRKNRLEDIFFKEVNGK